MNLLAYPAKMELMGGQQHPIMERLSRQRGTTAIVNTLEASHGRPMGVNAIKLLSIRSARQPIH